MGFDEDVALARKNAERVALELRAVHLSYGVLLACLALAVAWAAWSLWGWHERSMGRLESGALVLTHEAQAAGRSAEIWRTQALALARTRGADTVHTNTVIRTARGEVITVLLPITMPDGRVSEVPMSVVSVAQFDTVVGACTLERHNCSQLLAAKDSAAVQDSARIAALEALDRNTEQRLSSTRRAGFWTKLGWGAAGLGVGSLACRVR